MYLCVCIYIYIYIHIYVRTCMYAPGEAQGGLAEERVPDD